MIVMGRLILIKIRELLSQPFILLLLVVFPVVLGTIAGTANTMNRREQLDLAVVDDDQSVASQQLIATLRAGGWHVMTMEEEKAEDLLAVRQLDGLLLIREGFSTGKNYFNRPLLLYKEAEGSMMTALAREVIAAAVLPLAYQESLIMSLARLSDPGQTSPPAELSRWFEDALARELQQQAGLQLEYVGEMMITPTLTFIVSDYSMEVFFLSIYAILGSLALSKAALRQRLSSTRRGLVLDYTATIISLQMLGMAQIFCFSLAMFSLMAQDFSWHSLGILTVFLFFMLGFGQLLALIGESLRLYLSILLLLLSAILGGCFFQVSYRLLIRYGQYGPHGWALQALRRAESMPVWLVAGLSVMLLLTGFMAQKHRARSDLAQ